MLAGLAATRLSSWKLIYIGQSVLITAIFMLMLPLPTSVSVGALFLIGLGNAPIFPNILHLTPQNFGKEYSQSMMGAQMAVSYVGIALMPPLYGILAQKLSMSIFPYFIVLLFCMMVFSIYRLRATLKEQQIKLL
ncbi:MFS transporter [Paenibacillus albidus]|nr:MFS transporter [Paenibacillus albidus]